MKLANELKAAKMKQTGLQPAPPPTATATATVTVNAALPPASPPPAPSTVAFEGESSSSDSEDSDTRRHREQKLGELATWLRAQNISATRSTQYAARLYAANIPSISKLSIKMERDPSLLRKLKIDSDDQDEIIEGLKKVDFSHLPHHPHYIVRQAAMTEAHLRSLSLGTIDEKEGVSTDNDKGEDEEKRARLKDELKRLRRQKEELLETISVMSSSVSVMSGSGSKRSKKEKKEKKERRKDETEEERSVRKAAKAAKRAEESVEDRALRKAAKKGKREER
jgi:hypothetical protein